MAQKDANPFLDPEFIIAMEMRYEDVVWKEFDTQTDRSGPGFPGHTPIYPTEDSFLHMFSRLCTDLKQPDLTKVAGDEEDFSPKSPMDLFSLIDDDGIKRNHAMIMAVMLGLNEKECKQFVTASYEDYKERHPKISQQARWGLQQQLTYEDVKKAWEEKIGALTPNYEEVLGHKKDDAPEPAFVEPVVEHGDLEPEKPQEPARDTAHVAAEPEKPLTILGVVPKIVTQPRSPSSKKRKSPKAPTFPDEPVLNKPLAEAKVDKPVIAVAPSVIPDVQPDNIVINRIIFPQERQAFDEKIDAAVAIATGEGEDKNFPDQGSVLRALFKMARSQPEADVNVMHLLNPSAGLTRNEAIVLAVTIGLKYEEKSQYMREAQAAFAEAGGDVEKHWRHVENPVNEELLINVRPILVADAINEERKGIAINYSEISPKPPQKPKPPVTEAVNPEPIRPAVKTPVVEVPVAEVNPIISPDEPLTPLVVTPPSEPVSAPKPEVPVIAPVIAAAVAATAPQTSVIEPPVDAPVLPAHNAEPSEATDTSATDAPSVKKADILAPKVEKIPKPEKPNADKPKPAKDEGEPKPPRPAPKPARAEEKAPVVVTDDMRAGQKAAIEEARKQFAELKTHDEKAIAAISTQLILQLVEHSPLGVGYKAKKLHEAAAGKISIPAFQSLVGGGTLNPESFAVGGAIDALVPNIVIDPSYRDEVTNYLIGIPLPQMQSPAHDVVNYVKDKQGNIADVMRLMRRHHRRDIEHFCSEVLHLEKHAFTRLTMGKCQRTIGETDIVATAITNLGLEAKDDQLIFRKMALLIPLDTTQEALRECFTPPASAPVSDEIDATETKKKHYFVDADATEPVDRAVALSRFYALLRMVHGKRDFNELAEAIAAKSDKGSAVKEEISRSMNNSGGRGGFDPDKEGAIQEKSNKKINIDIAKMIADFAFPDPADGTLRDQCVEFLGSEEKYRLSQSAALEKAWVTRSAASGGGAVGATDDDEPPASQR